MDPVTEIAEEWVDEVMGTSSKRWALILVAFVAGAIGGTLAGPARRSTRPVPTEPVTAPVESGAP